MYQKLIEGLKTCTHIIIHTHSHLCTHKQYHLHVPQLWTADEQGGEGDGEGEGEGEGGEGK